MDMNGYLKRSAWSTEDVDYFLDPASASWARFDADTGYALADVCIRDGIDGAHTFNTYRPDGARRMIHYADSPCRIDTFGDSFTQCHQVSDGETWQEVLAAHLGEPIRNFGVGGFGVYQAFCRMRVRAAAGDLTPFIILNIYDDDHVRNLDSARWFRISKFRTALGQDLRPMLHANPWPHLRWDPAHDSFIEQPNPLPTPDSLYRFADPNTVAEMFGEDEIVALECLQTGVEIQASIAEQLQSLAASLGVPTEQATVPAANLLTAYGLRSTLYTLDLARALAADNGSQFMVLLSYSAPQIRAHINGATRFDQPLLDYLQTHDVPYVDALTAHEVDSRDFALSPDRYTDRYMQGHYTPTGNAFFASAIKDALVAWLDPKPPAYPGTGAPFAAASLLA